MLACGGGVPAARYARFARFLAARGIPVLTFDYRGIAFSRPSNLRRFRAVAEDWSEFDCGGGVAYLRSVFPDAELVAIAHSIGTLLIGGAPNVAQISRFVFVCAHTGYYGDYLPKYRLPMAVLWHLIMPMTTRVVGYFPARLLRIGEDIPAGVAMQWAARRTPALQPDAKAGDMRRAQEMIARYQNVTGRTFALGFTDDAFATEAGARRLLSAYPRLQPQLRLIAPSEAGMTKIGHFGFFRQEAEMLLWPLVARFVLDGGDPFHPEAQTPA